MSSLQDQLLKAGLVSRDKSDQVQTEARKRDYQLKKIKALANAEEARKLQQQRERELAAERQRERDRLLNQEQEAAKRRQADLARARQLIDHHRLTTGGGNVRYHFVLNGRYVRSIQVTPQQQMQLAAGQIGIVRGVDDEYDDALLPRATINKLMAFDPDRVLLLHPVSLRVEDDLVMLPGGRADESDQ